MARRHPLFNQVIENLTITGFAAEGKAIARVGEMVLFLNYGAPGDVVDVRISKTKKNFLEGEILRIHKPSEDRTEPFCAHFGICGGCKWQHLGYDRQLHYKQQQVVDSLERIGRVKPGSFELVPIAGTEHATFYRNKLEFTFSNKRWLTRKDIDSGREFKDLDGLGFHIPGLYDKVLDIEKCWLQPEPSNSIRLAVKGFAKEKGLSFYNIKEDAGLLRNLIIRNSSTGEVMVSMIFGEDKPEQISLVMDYIRDSFPEVTTLAYFINDKKNSSLADLEAVIYHGKPFMLEEMEGLRFAIGPKSFFQTNAPQAYKLYRIARDFAGLEGHELVYDLYTGTGTIALFLAQQAAKVVGVEYVEEAVEHARENAAFNGVTNTLFFAGDMASVFNETLLDRHGYPHVVVTDPPRAGMHPDVVKQIIRSGADKVIYVSCNPATQARDIAMLSNMYILKKVQPVDMFPHTQHVESVALLIRKGREG
ncbi:MAG: 23S rRNA (uracil(1939)-C(5))-methyltransferase RlmD [Bacteroidales bacterium]|jgi:23S rRNA (uracil1939-C5)-methyltransferase|nr:23S rRNA (uracil(1939)-C(5))-methyltransferase RlmD [Bacteroidales bacterium]NLM91445.1 23S rRNA (uracil(1939)-C(5))-methyltransferase RlmD [Bacteroidales bacterium]